MRNLLSELLPGMAGIQTDIVIERTLAGAAQMLISRIGMAERELLLVCDANSYAALGSRLIAELSAFRTHLLMLQSPVHADEKTLRKIAACPGDALIAIGSGTINDLCKYVSFKSGKPYAVFPTAPSMNGYLSANASLFLNGIKKSHQAHIPIGVFCDLGVLAAAPKRLIRSGLGDSLCRPTAQADWLLSHLLLDTFYSEQPFNLLKPFEAELFAHTDKLMKGDLEVITLLVKTLLASGLGMTLVGGSYPASQGEHMIAHTMEMKYGDALPHSYHGEQIGITTLTMAGLQEDLLSRPLTLPPLPEWEKELEKYFGAKRGKVLAKSIASKYIFYAHYEQFDERLHSENKVREKIRTVTLPKRTLQSVLEKADAPTLPEHIGLEQCNYYGAIRHAAFTRDRFTFLELLK